MPGALTLVPSRCSVSCRIGKGDVLRGRGGLTSNGHDRLSILRLSRLATKPLYLRILSFDLGEEAVDLLLLLGDHGREALVLHLVELLLIALLGIWSIVDVYLEILLGAGNFLSQSACAWLGPLFLDPSHFCRCGRQLRNESLHFVVVEFAGL